MLCRAPHHAHHEVQSRLAYSPSRDTGSVLSEAPSFVEERPTLIECELRFNRAEPSSRKKPGLGKNLESVTDPKSEASAFEKNIEIVGECSSADLDP